MNILLFISAFTGFYVLLESLKRRFHWPQPYTRKFAHAVSALGAISASFFTTQTEFIVVTFFFTIIFLIAYTKGWFTAIHAVAYTTYGEVTFPLALTLLAVFFFHNFFVFVSALLILGIADAVAALPDISQQQKTWRGNIFFLVSTITILFGMTAILQIPLTPLQGFILITIASLLTYIEQVSSHGLDNLTVPLACAVMLEYFFK